MYWGITFGAIWINAPLVDVAIACAIGGSAAGLASVLELFNIADITQTFDHDRSSSISQLIKGKSRDN